MNHKIHRVVDFTIMGSYTIRVDFSDGVSRTINFRPVLEGEMYGPLRDLALFNRVEIDPEAHTLVWPNGADFDPATLHDWDEVSDEFAGMARRWSESLQTVPTVPSTRR